MPNPVDSLDLTVNCRGSPPVTFVLSLSCLIIFPIPFTIQWSFISTAAALLYGSSYFPMVLSRDGSTPILGN